MGRTQTTALVDNLRIDGSPLTLYIHYGHEGYRGGDYGDDHSNGIWPVVPVCITPEIGADGAIVVMVCCLIQIADCGMGGWMEAWPASANNLFTREGETYSDFLRRHGWMVPQNDARNMAGTQAALAN